MTGQDEPGADEPHDDDAERWQDLVKDTELLDHELPDPRFVDATYLRWLYDENPLGRAYDAHIDEDGVRVGHYALIPQTYRNRHGRRPFVFSLNAVARAGSQRRGFFGKLGGEVWGRAQDAGVRNVIGVMNAKSTGAVRKNGWRILGQLPVTVTGPTARPSGDVESYDITPELLGAPMFDDLVAGLDDSPAWHWTNCYTPEYLRWRLSARNSPRFTLHRDHELVAISTTTKQGGVPFAVVLKLLPRDGRFGPISARPMISAVCRYHRAPLAVYAGHNRHVAVTGLPLPERLKPAPLVLGILSLSDEVDQNTFALDTFEFLDMDAY